MKEILTPAERDLRALSAEELRKTEEVVIAGAKSGDPFMHAVLLVCINPELIRRDMPFIDGEAYEAIESIRHEATGLVTPE